MAVKVASGPTKATAQPVNISAAQEKEIEDRASHDGKAIEEAFVRAIEATIGAKQHAWLEGGFGKD